MLRKCESRASQYSLLYDFIYICSYIVCAGEHDGWIEGWKVNQIRQWCATLFEKQVSTIGRLTHSPKTKQKKCISEYTLCVCFRSHHQHQRREPPHTTYNVSKSDLKFNKHLRCCDNRAIAYRYLYYLNLCKALRLEIRRESLRKRKRRRRISRISSWPFSVLFVQRAEIPMDRTISHNWIGSLRSSTSISLKQNDGKWQWRETHNREIHVLRRRKKTAKPKSINACIKMFYVDSTDFLSLDVVVVILPPCGCCYGFGHTLCVYADEKRVLCVDA